MLIFEFIFNSKSLPCKNRQLQAFVKKLAIHIGL